jgi:hypothetical protein
VGDYVQVKAFASGQTLTAHEIKLLNDQTPDMGDRNGGEDQSGGGNSNGNGNGNGGGNNGRGNGNGGGNGRGGGKH